MRVGVDTWVVGAPGALVVDGTTLSPPYSVLAIGDPPTLAAAMNIPGGAMDSVERVGGTMVGAAGRRGRRDRLAATETPPIRSARQVSPHRRAQKRSAVSEIPSDLYYTADHEWVRRTGDDTVRVGITDYAQSALGDVVFVELPDVGAEVTAGGEFGDVESTKSKSDLYAPITAKVVAVNGDLADSPELVNSDPYGDGWLDRPAGRRRGAARRGAGRLCSDADALRCATGSTNENSGRLIRRWWTQRRPPRGTVVRETHDGWRRGRRAGPARHRHSSQ